MESRSRLKQRLTHLFRPSTLLRTSCNSTSSNSVFTTSSGANGSSRSLSTATTDTTPAHEPPLFIIPHDSLFIRSINNTKLDRSLSFSLSSLDCSGACRPTKSSEADVVTKPDNKPKKMERRVRETGEFYETGEREGRTCPPASPSSPSTDYYFDYYGFNKKDHEEEEKQKKKDKVKNVKKKKKKKKHQLLVSNAYGFSSSSDDDGSEFFSNEDETDTFFSSRSFSSDSSEFYKRPSSTRKKNKKNKNKRIKSSQRPPRRGTMTMKEEEEEEKSGIPVIKRSSNPYVDFRDSMVEMIVERQIFGAKDLERLLHSYLSLNSPHHHAIILRAFADISQVLFGH